MCNAEEKKRKWIPTFFLVTLKIFSSNVLMCCNTDGILYDWSARLSSLISFLHQHSNYTPLFLCGVYFAISMLFSENMHPRIRICEKISFLHYTNGFPTLLSPTIAQFNFNKTINWEQNNEKKSFFFIYDKHNIFIYANCTLKAVCTLISSDEWKILSLGKMFCNRFF